MWMWSGDRWPHWGARNVGRRFIAGGGDKEMCPWNVLTETWGGAIPKPTDNSSILATTICWTLTMSQKRGHVWNLSPKGAHSLGEETAPEQMTNIQSENSHINNPSLILMVCQALYCDCSIPHEETDLKDSRSSRIHKAKQQWLQFLPVYFKGHVSALPIVTPLVKWDKTK